MYEDNISRSIMTTGGCHGIGETITRVGGAFMLVLSRKQRFYKTISVGMDNVDSLVKR